MLTRKSSHACERSVFLRFFWVVVTSMLMMSCGTLSPYVEPSVKRPGTAFDNTGKPKTHADNSTLVTTFVSVPVAREYGRFLQDAYRQKSRTALQLRATYDIAMISIATTAVGLAAVGNAKQAAAILGLTAGGLGIFGNRYLDVYQRRAYFQGALAIECIIGESVYSLTLDASAVPVQSAMSSTRVAISQYARVRNEILSILSEEGKTSEAQIFRANTDLVINSAQADIALANEYLQAASPVGQYMLSKIESIRLLVDQAVAESEPNILQLNTDIRSTLLGTANLVTNIPAAEFQLKDQPDGSTAIGAQSAAVVSKTALLLNLEKSLVSRQNALIKSVNNLSKSNGGKARIPEGLFEKCSLDPNGQQLAQLIADRKSANQTGPKPGNSSGGTSGQQGTLVDKTDTFYVQSFLQKKASQFPAAKEINPGVVSGRLNAETRRAMIQYILLDYDNLLDNEAIKKDLGLDSKEKVESYYGQGYANHDTSKDFNLLRAFISQFSVPKGETT